MATTTTKKKTAAEPAQAKETGRRFTTAFVGNTPAGPFAFQVEGNLTRPCELREMPDGRPVLNNSIGIGRSAFALLALAEGTYDKDAKYPDNPFVELAAFGDVAKRMAELGKGVRIVVTGKLSKRTWKDKANADRESVQIQVSEFAVLSCKAAPKGEGAKTTVPATNQFTKKDGEEVLRPVACLVSGTIYNVDELGTAPSGNSYLHFNMFAQEPAEKVLDKARGVDTADKEYDPKRTLIRCSAFGRQAEALAKLLKKGMQVVVSGNVTDNVFEGKTSVQMTVNALNVVNFEAPTGTSAVIPLPEDAGDAPVNETAPANGEVTGDFFQGEDEGDDDGALPF